MRTRLQIFWTIFLTLLLCAGSVSLGEPTSAPATARQAFDAYLSKNKSGHAKDAATEVWDFKAFLTNAFGDQFTKHTQAEQAEMVRAFQQIMVDSMGNPKMAELMSKAQAKKIVEFKVADDRSFISFDYILADGTTIQNQMEFRKTAAGWKVVDSGVGGAMLSSQLRGQYSNVASKQTLLAYIRDMAAPGK